jgi:hypothetical protein
MARAIDALSSAPQSANYELRTRFTAEVVQPQIGTAKSKILTCWQLREDLAVRCGDEQLSPVHAWINSYYQSRRAFDSSDEGAHN